MPLTVTEMIGDRWKSYDATSQNVVYNLLPFANTPNKFILLQKTDSSVNTVTLNTYTGDTFTNGVTSLVLTDNVSNSFTLIQKSGVAGVPGIIVAGVGSPSAGAVLVYKFDVTVSAPITYNAGAGGVPSVVAGATLNWRLTQDSTGHAVTWGTHFKAMPNIPTAASKVSIGTAMGGSDGNWWGNGFAILGHSA